MMAAVMTAASASGHAQTAQASPASAVLSANFGTAQPQTIILNGTVTVYGGAKPERGTVKLTADANGASHAVFDLPSGERAEEQWDDTSQRRCRVAVAGKEDTRLTPNCWISSPWFFPQMAMLDATQKAIETEDLGVVTEDNAATRVLRTSRVPGSRFKSSADGALMKSWSQTKLHLTPETLLPSTLTYTLYGDRSIRATIAVKVAFSAYQTVNGIQIPHHIQRYLNNALQADIVVSSVEVK